MGKKFYIGYDEVPEGGISTDKKEEGQENIKEKKERVDNRSRELWISDRRREKILKEMEMVVVHDFDDEYHLSEEERKEANEFYDIFKRLRVAKHKYRKLDEFVEVVREALKCLDAVAETNGVYDPDKFKRLWLKGKIKIYGLWLPKYNGKDKKQLSWDYITDFIVNQPDKDPSELIMKLEPDDMPITAEEYEKARNQMFDKDELDEILREPTEKEIMDQLSYFDIEEEDPEGKNIAIDVSKKEMRKLLKHHKELGYTLSNAKKQDRSIDTMERYSWSLLADDMEYIEKANKKYGFKKHAKDIPEFTGDIFNDDDYNRYMYQLEEYENTQVTKEYAGKLKTQEEIDEIELKRVLDAAGWNIRNFYKDDREKKYRKQKKKDKKRVKKIKEKLLKTQEKMKKRKKLRKMGEDYEPKKHKKKKGKGKNKGKKKKG